MKEVWKLYTKPRTKAKFVKALRVLFQFSLLVQGTDTLSMHESSTVFLKLATEFFEPLCGESWSFWNECPLLKRWKDLTAHIGWWTFCHAQHHVMCVCDCVFCETLNYMRHVRIIQCLFFRYILGHYQWGSTCVWAVGSLVLFPHTPVFQLSVLGYDSM